MLTPVSEHELLLFWLQLFVLLGAARVLGGLAARAGQPRIVGELGAGVVLGPTILGRLAPGVAEWLFPGDPVQSALLLAIAWFGILLLLVVTGFETDVGLLSRLGRASILVSLGSLIVPVLAGFGLGLVLPTSVQGEDATTFGFAAFLAVAVAVSSLPVVAKILADMRMMRRNVGQLIVAAATANDIIGLMLLGAVTGIFTSGTVDAGALLRTLVAVLIFLGLALSLGQRLTDRILRRAQGLGGYSGVLAAGLLVALGLGAITQAIGVEVVLGALVAGVVLGRSRYQRDDVRRTFETLSSAVFAPLFFATAGLYADLAAIFSPVGLAVTGALLAVAVLSKLVGTWVSGRAAGMDSRTALAIGVGLNARGAIGVVVATVGIRLGALNEVSYAAVVVMAIATSIAAPPMLRSLLDGMRTEPEEAERLEREERLNRSIVANVRSALLPTRGGLNSAVAARMLDAALQPEAAITVLEVHPDSARPADLSAVRAVLGERPDVDWRLQQAPDAAAAILAETGLGYGLITLGLNEDFVGSHRLSDPIQRVIADVRAPLLLVRRGRHVHGAEDVEVGRVRRLLVPVTGTRPGRAAEELASRIGGSLDAEVEGVHVVTRDRGPTGTDALPAVAHQVERARSDAASFGREATVTVRHAPVAHEELLRRADEVGADTVILGAQLRSHDGRPFLGHGTEWVLEHASQTVVAVVFPSAGDES